MSLYSTGTGRVSTGWMYGGMAVRMILEMRWHEQPDMAMMAFITPLEFEIRKRAWWLCFLFDTISSITAGRPSFVDPDEPMVDYPDDELWNSLDDDGFPTPSTPGYAAWVQQGKRGMLGITGTRVASPATGSPFTTLRMAQPSYNTLGQSLPSLYFCETAEMIVIFNRVVKYVRIHKSRRTQIGLIDDKLSTLDMQLKEFWGRLSDRARQEFQPTRFLPTGGVVEEEVLELCGNANLHLLFHSATILLHRPELTLQDFVWPTRASFDVCTHAANRIAIIAERMLAAAPLLSHFSPAVNFPLFEAGMVHLVNALVSSLIPPSPKANGQPGEPSAPTAEVMTRARRSVAVTLEALNRLRRYWASAEAYHASLSKAARENGILPV
ncbi:hypothetical protein M427DRAFT_296769 [Gonapodya prolifera JEL478]|uniref:Xylanolytic transcriptional activator regulatory domain-containing protein n=1 Tax=Gonapodya prolifera (strain JEL478) TaxID=1344416 RepID=A0A139AJ01_GONPJ|nr:hypothetical protein M427DRAFT_296769 [Gonapodya prolifera JEL478]|eukprot:KXS16375.1 hypothetical protein M427DRAFT_296769 [Gonapodya prolifera JEL478]